MNKEKQLSSAGQTRDQEWKLYLSEGKKTDKGEKKSKANKKV